jgi:hypothetical protein
MERHQFLNINTMPDITKCKGNNCLLKVNCYRYTSEPSEYHQSYFVEEPGTKNESGEIDQCSLFHGEAQESLMNHLRDIVSGKLNK